MHFSNNIAAYLDAELWLHLCVLQKEKLNLFQMQLSNEMTATEGLYDFAAIYKIDLLFKNSGDVQTAQRFGFVLYYGSFASCFLPMICCGICMNYSSHEQTWNDLSSIASIAWMD